jgi:hypothetical protein
MKSGRISPKQVCHFATIYEPHKSTITSIYTPRLALGIDRQAVSCSSCLFLTLQCCTDKGNKTWFVCFMSQALLGPTFTHCCMCDSSIWLALLRDNGYGMLVTHRYGTEQHTALHTMCNGTLITDVSTHPVRTFEMSLPWVSNIGQAITICIFYIQFMCHLINKHCLTLGYGLDNTGIKIWFLTKHKTFSLLHSNGSEGLFPLG